MRFSPARPRQAARGGRGIDPGGGAPEPCSRSAVQLDQLRRSAAPAGDADWLSTPLALTMIEGSKDRVVPQIVTRFRRKVRSGQHTVLWRSSPDPSVWIEGRFGRLVLRSAAACSFVIYRFWGDGFASKCGRSDVEPVLLEMRSAPTRQLEPNPCETHC